MFSKWIFFMTQVPICMYKLSVLKMNIYESYSTVWQKLRCNRRVTIWSCSWIWHLLLNLIAFGHADCKSHKGIALRSSIYKATENYLCEEWLTNWIYNSNIVPINWLWILTISMIKSCCVIIMHHWKMSIQRCCYINVLSLKLIITNCDCQLFKQVAFCAYVC